MTRRPVHPFDDVLRATGSGWEELPHGFKLEILDETVQAEADRITVKLPPEALDSFKPRAGDRLQARVVRGKLLVERDPRRAARKPSRT